MAESAAILARVSTAAQLDNTSAEEQIKRCRLYCKAQNYVVVIEKVEAISGTVVLARSEFNALLELAAEGKISVIVADIPDRLGRGDAIAKLELLAQLYGARIEYAQPSRDTSTVEGLALAATDQLVSGIERINIRRRTMDGRRALARSGRVIASGLRPYGYKFTSTYDKNGRKASCEMVIEEGEARIVRLIFEWYVYESMSVYAITKRLTEMGVPTLRDMEETTQKKSRQKGYWNRATVFGMLHNTTYMGEWRYAKFETILRDTPDGVKKTSRERGSDEQIVVQVPSIISRELFEQTQELLKSNRHKNFRPVKHPYLLRSRIRCALCGSSMVGTSKSRKLKDGSRRAYYRCRRTAPEFKPNQCHCRQIKADRLDNEVWRNVIELLQDEKLLFEGLEEQREETKRARRTIDGTIAAIEVQIKKGNERINRLLDLYTNGELDKEIFLSKRDELEKELEKRKTERQELARQHEQYNALDPDREMELRTLRLKMLTGADNATFEEKKRLIESLSIHCVYDERNSDVVINGVLGERTVPLTSIPPRPHPQATCTAWHSPRCWVAAQKS